MTYRFILYLILLLCISFQGIAKPIKIIAHRGGAGEFPENTLYAFQHSVNAGVDGIELDVQLTKDNIVVVYHPRNLSKNTNGIGNVVEYEYKDIKKLDAGFNFDPLKNGSYPYRNKRHYIPTLEEVLKNFPNIPIIIDFKSIPEEPLVDSVIKVVNQYNAWGNIVFYSTNPRHINTLTRKVPYAKVFEDRHVTLKRLLTFRNTDICCCASTAQYVGFELSREMMVEETFELGSDRQTIFFNLWDNLSVACTRKNAKNKEVFVFNINTQSEYDSVKKLDIDAIFTNHPERLIKIKDSGTPI